ncbi:carboxypeptidase regulatory-like domain-containing protein, partial [Pedobacter sp.]|uniref:carboxypeptidase regulatory-like domain-containing protein n=1 Tax=Pedobacter sp. TaxID=1411316 RepID=UPI003D7FBA4E
MTRIFTPTLLLIVLMMTAAVAFGQNKNGSAKGTIVNAKDKLPVDFATVAVKSLKDSSVVASSNTAIDGGFEFKGLAPGNYRLYVAYLGLQSVTKDFTVNADGNLVDLGA